MKRISLQNSKKKALVDDYWYEIFKHYKWRINHHGYVWNRDLGLMHRFIMHSKLLHNKELQVHHLKSKLDNRVSSLQLVTQDEHVAIHNHTL